MQSAFIRRLTQAAIGLTITAAAHSVLGQEKTKLSIAHIGPATALNVIGTVGALKASLEATGKAEVTMYGTGSAYSIPTKFSELTETGVVDITFGVQQFEAGRYPLNLLAADLFPVNDAARAARAYLRALRATPELEAEFKPNRVMIVGVTTAEQIHSRKPLKTINDLKGLRVMAINPLVVGMIRELGGSVVTLPQPAHYENLQKGVVDAVSAPWAGTIAFRTIEVTSHHLEINSVTTPFYFIINQKKYDSLPPELKKIIDDFSTDEVPVRFAGVWGKLDETGIAEAIKRNHVTAAVSDTERAVLRKRFQHLNLARIAELDKKGLLASKVAEAIARAMDAESGKR